jgi:hypothetical protein
MSTPSRPRLSRPLPVPRFGPTSETIELFYRALPDLQVEGWREAGERWIALEPPQYGRADRIATGLIEGLERNGAWVAARVELEHILDDRRQHLRRTRPDQLLAAGLGFNAAQCAIVALLVHDRLPPDALEVLYCPFEALIPFASITGSTAAPGGPSPVLDLTARLRRSTSE